MAIWEERRLKALLELQAARDHQMAEVEPLSPQPRAKNIAPKALAASLILVLALLAATIGLVTFGRGPAHSHGPFRAASVEPPLDGADPVDSGCSIKPGVHILDYAEVDYDGMPVGLAELVYSPLCGVTWARFDPFSKARIPADATIRVDVVRISPHRLKESYSAPYVGKPVYGNVLQSTETCVYATVTIEVRGRKLPASHTHCFRGDVPVEAGGG